MTGRTLGLTEDEAIERVQKALTAYVHPGALWYVSAVVLDALGWPKDRPEPHAPEGCQCAWHRAERRGPAHRREYAGAGPDDGTNRGSYCPACSKVVGDYVWPCKVRPPIPPRDPRTVVQACCGDTHWGPEPEHYPCPEAPDLIVLNIGDQP